MNTDQATEFLGRLLNKPLTPATRLRLSSAQRARFGAWLQQQGISIDSDRIAGEFSLDSIAHARQAEVPARTEPMSRSTREAGIGVDIQSITEFSTGLNVDDFKSDTEALRIFTLRELSYAQGRPHPAETLAGVFAAKEAVQKCIGSVDVAPDALRAIEVLPDESGRPTTPGFLLSVSHSGDFAIAVACHLPVANPTAPSDDPMYSAPSPEGWRHWIPLGLLASIVVLIAIHLLLIVQQSR